MENKRWLNASVSVSLLFLYISIAFGECPPCYKDLTLFPGQGDAPDGSGRRIN